MEHNRLIHIILLIAITVCNSYSQITPSPVDLISNGNKLYAQIYLSNSNNYSPTLIMMHGFPGGQGDPLGLGESLSAKGINVLVFNYQGTWSSEGSFSFESSLEDAGNAIKFLKKENNIEDFNIDTSNIVLGGYSYGGAMALIAAIYNPEILRVISVAGPDESVFGRKIIADQNFGNVFKQMLQDSFYPDGPIKGDFEAQMNFWLSNLKRYDLVLNADSLESRGILLIGGWYDMDVMVEEHLIPFYRRLQQLNTKNLDIITFNTDHSFNKVREELSEEIFRWIINKK